MGSLQSTETRNDAPSWRHHASAAIPQSQAQLHGTHWAIGRSRTSPTCTEHPRQPSSPIRLLNVQDTSEAVPIPWAHPPPRHTLRDTCLIMAYADIFRSTEESQKAYRKISVCYSSFDGPRLRSKRWKAALLFREARYCLRVGIWAVASLTTPFVRCVRHTPFIGGSYPDQFSACFLGRCLGPACVSSVS